MVVESQAGDRDEKSKSGQSRFADHIHVEGFGSLVELTENEATALLAGWYDSSHAGFEKLLVDQ